MRSLAHDLRHGLRIFLKSPNVMITAALTLALSLAANATIFSIADDIWLRPMPVRDPSSLVRVSSQRTTGSAEENDAVSFPEYRAVRDSVQALEGAVASSRRGLVLKSSDETVLLMADLVSDNYFEVMGIEPVRGRRFTRIGSAGTVAAPEILLGYRAWIRYFRADKQIIGRSIILNNNYATVVGVLPQNFHGTETLVSPDVFVPYSTWIELVPGERQYLETRDNREFSVYGRLRRDLQIEQAKSQLQALGAGLDREYPDTDSGRRLTVRFEREARNPKLKRLSLLLLSIGAAVLLLACANIANLLLARGESRRHEIAMRRALGATRGRLVRQLFTESMVLSVIGAVAGLVLANWFTTLVPHFVPWGALAIALDPRCDSRAVAYTLVACFFATLLFGMFPALRTTEAGLGSIVRGPGRSLHSTVRIRVRSIVVAFEVAVSVVLLIITFLLVKTVQRLQAIDPGFDATRDAVLIDLGVGVADYSTPEVNHYFDTIIDAAESIVSVRQVGLTGRMPLSMFGGGATISVVPDSDSQRDSGMEVGYTSVNPTYFNAVGTGLQRGRNFTTMDREGTPLVVIINGTLARRLFGTVAATGMKIHVGHEPAEAWEIVGIVQDGKYNDLSEEPKPYMFFPLAQDPRGEVTVVAATDGDPGAVANTIRQKIRAVNPEIPVLGVRTLAEHMKTVTDPQEVTACLVGGLGVLGLVMASVGVFGLTSYVVSGRTREIAIRVAVGATPSVILRMIAMWAVLLIGLSTAVGLCAAALLTWTIRSFLFGVSPIEGGIFLAIGCLVLGLGLMASLAAGWRATKVDPMSVLRHEAL